MRPRHCEMCGRQITRPSRGDLVQLLIELHGELTALTAPAGGHDPTYRCAYAVNRIASVLRDENRRFCIDHWSPP